MVWDAVPVFPQLSVTVQVLVILTPHPFVTGVQITPVATKFAAQLSETLAEPNAAAICVDVGLQGKDFAGVNVISGRVVSRVKRKV